MATVLENPSNGNLSNGNLTFTSLGPAYALSSRRLTGKTYVEATLNTITGVPSIAIGSPVWSGGQAGGDSSSAGYLSSGAVKWNATTLATLSTYTSGDRIGMAVDILNRLFWFRVNGGNWNGSVSNDPATGVGGLSFAVPSSVSAAMMATFIFGITCSLTGAVWTVNFSGPFTDTVPSGYSSIDTQQITLARSVIALDAFPIVALSTTAIARVASMPAGDRLIKTFSPANAITNVSGVTQESGVAVPGRRVDVYDRDTGDLLGTTFSDGSGNWSLSCVGRPKVRVVGSDPTTFNSVVFDNVQGL